MGDNPRLGELDRSRSFEYESSGSELNCSVRQPRSRGKTYRRLCRGARDNRSAAQQAFDGRNHHAGNGVHKKTIVNPVPREPDHQENVARRQNVAGGQTGTRSGNGAQCKNDSHRRSMACGAHLGPIVPGRIRQVGVVEKL